MLTSKPPIPTAAAAGRPAATQGEGSAGFASAYSPQSDPAAGARPDSTAGTASRPVFTGGSRPPCRASLRGAARTPLQPVGSGPRAGRPRVAQVPKGAVLPAPSAGPGRRGRRRWRGACAHSRGDLASYRPRRAALRAAGVERRLPPDPLHLPAAGPLRDRPRGEGKRKSLARPGEKRRREGDAGQPRFPGCPSASSRAARPVPPSPRRRGQLRITFRRAAGS